MFAIGRRRIIHELFWDVDDEPDYEVKESENLLILNFKEASSLINTSQNHH